MKNNTLLLLAVGVMLLLSLSGCALFADTQGIETQDAIISSNMNSAENLLVFDEQTALLSMQPTYQGHSAAIGAACEQLDSLDKDKTYRSKNSALVCANKNGLDKCFFQLETIKLQLKNNDSSVNLDSLDVLCSDLRALGLQSNLDNFKSKYENYTSWLKAEDGILASWSSLETLFWNSSSPQPTGTKLSDYYTVYQGQMAGAETSLQSIKNNCALKDGFKTTSDKIEKVCNNVDEYIANIETANGIVVDSLNFFGKLEVGSVTIDATFIHDCNQITKEYSSLYDLKLLKDTNLNNSNQTDLSSMCGQIEYLSSVYAAYGIPLILENGDLSSTTRTELFKAKTVYIETDEVLGSGVIIDSDSSGYYILTNAHVALTYDPSTGTEYLPIYARVKFYDGKVGYATRLANTLEGYDLALLYVPSSGNYPIASFDETYYPNAGDKVIAVGNPYGFVSSVSEGTVSGLRDLGCLRDYCYGEVIQTDAALNAGNSGGGLWDYASQDLIGINSLSLTQTEGLNFAISMYQYGKIKDTFKWYDI
ncbi:Trypsin-like peptidase domain protein [Candidatus Burarchaeum australiense]|nr:Trypsin-like peptidase domain protein [Candidatus Burarchaeum australiense]